MQAGRLAMFLFWRRHDTLRIAIKRIKANGSVIWKCLVKRQTNVLRNARWHTALKSRVHLSSSVDGAQHVGSSHRPLIVSFVQRTLTVLHSLVCDSPRCVRCATCIMHRSLSWHSVFIITYTSRFAYFVACIKVCTSSNHRYSYSKLVKHPVPNWSSWELGSQTNGTISNEDASLSWIFLRSDFALLFVDFCPTFLTPHWLIRNPALS